MSIWVYSLSILLGLSLRLSSRLETSENVSEYARRLCWRSKRVSTNKLSSVNRKYSLCGINRPLGLVAAHTVVLALKSNRISSFSLHRYREKRFAFGATSGRDLLPRREGNILIVSCHCQVKKKIFVVMDCKLINKIIKNYLLYKVI